MNKRIRYSLQITFAVSLTFLLSRCGHPDPVVFRRIEHVQIVPGNPPVLSGSAIFYNPNNSRGKLKKISVNILVDDQPAGVIDETFKTIITPNAEFTVPLKVTLQIDKHGVVDTLLGILGRKKATVRFKGNLNVVYHAVLFSVPVDYVTEVRISL